MLGNGEKMRLPWGEGQGRGREGPPRTRKAHNRKGKSNARELWPTNPPRSRDGERPPARPSPHSQPAPRAPTAPTLEPARPPLRQGSRALPDAGADPIRAPPRAPPPAHHPCLRADSPPAPLP